MNEIPYIDEKEKQCNDIINETNYIEKNRSIIPKRILNKTDSEQTSTPSPKRSRKFKRPNKLAMKLYFMNALKQNKTNAGMGDKATRKCKSDSDLSLCSGGSGLQNLISFKRKISFYRNPIDINRKNKANMLTNFTTKSFINIIADDVNDNNFKELLKRKNSETLKSNTPRIFISKPDEICDDNFSNF